MEAERKTIVALSSGMLPSGVAVIRISGPEVASIANSMLGGLPGSREAVLRQIRHPETGEVLDNGIVLYFDGPRSFTGEDCLEYQVHGGKAVVSAILDALLVHKGVRIAEAGEFSRRAFENGRMDLTEAEGIADLIVSETESQRRLALSQSMGELRKLYDDWRKRLIHLRAMIEAELDFSEEEDVPKDISAAGFSQIASVSREIHQHLADNRAGEIVREGFKVALMGKPNAGKSSLLNALARRDVAIVTEEEGTTRDVIDVHLDIDGHAVIVSDTAGIRESGNRIEQEGIRRARQRGERADLVIWLGHPDEILPSDIVNLENLVHMISKDDDGFRTEGTSFSSQTGYGMDSLLEMISGKVQSSIGNIESGLITRARHRALLESCYEHLILAMRENMDIELRAENLRLASDEIGRITGRIDVEDLLDVIFSEFCVGK